MRSRIGAATGARQVDTSYVLACRACSCRFFPVHGPGWPPSAPEANERRPQCFELSLLFQMVNLDYPKPAA
jgi:hypothetical protein